MAIRLKDIAQDLGVSVVTVSKVLRNHEDISPATRERVLQRMKELNYQPNPAARALVTGRSNLVGLVVPDLVHPFFSQVAKSVSAELRKQGYSLVISSSEEDAELERLEIQSMMARRLDVLIVASSQPDPSLFEGIEVARRLVLIDREFSGFSANFVGVDNVAIGRLATEHLIQMGCRRIAHIGGRQISPALSRAEGYRQAMAAAGLPIPDGYLGDHAHADDAGDVTGYKAMTRLLAGDPRPDAVFCINDPVAMGAMRAIREAYLRIPNDIAVVGAGNVNYAPFLQIPLTSVDQNIPEMGLQTARLVLAMAGSQETPEIKRVLLEPKLVVRESSQLRA